MDDGSNNSNKTPRRKGLTSLTLQWLADKLRRTDQIKDELSRGTYKVDSAKVAQAIVSTSPSSRDDSAH
jgi:anti-sigma28 factor (negative regulator of flagellin synthesis)